MKIYSWKNLVFLALVFFCQQASVPGLFKDGYLYTGLAKNVAESGQWWILHLDRFNFNEFVHHPPMAFILHSWFIKIFGSSWTAIRLYSVSYALLLLGLTYWLLKRLWKPNAAWAYFSTLCLILTPPLFKKARSPNLDLPLTFFIFLGLVLFLVSFDYVKNKKVSFLIWTGIGLCLGLALLTKGPPALLLLAVIGLSILLFERSLILSPFPYWGVVVGLCVFLIWPFTLYLHHRMDLFYAYLDFQVVGTIMGGRGKSDLALWTYPVYLLENNPLNLFLSLGAIWLLFFRQRLKTIPLFVKVFLLQLILVLGPFSLVKWKYSNYIVPCFPALSVLSGFTLMQLQEKWHYLIQNTVSFLSKAAALVLLIFPLTTKIHRDPYIFQALPVMESLHLLPARWVVISNSYPYYDLVNMVGMLKLGSVSTWAVQKFINRIWSEDKFSHSRVFVFAAKELAYAKKCLKKLGMDMQMSPQYKMQEIVVNEQKLILLYFEGNKNG